MLSVIQRYADEDKAAAEKKAVEVFLCASLSPLVCEPPPKFMMADSVCGTAFSNLEHDLKRLSSVQTFALHTHVNLTPTRSVSFSCSLRMTAIVMRYR